PLLVVVIARLFFQRFYRDAPVLSLLFTFALAMVIEQGLRMIFGATPLPFSIPAFARGQVIIGDFFYPIYRIAMLVIAMLAVVGTWILLNRTAFGNIVQAGINDPDMERALGIS